MNRQRLSPPIQDALAAGDVLLVTSAQRQAALRAAWSELQHAAGRRVWDTPRVFTFNQYCERLLGEQWGARAQRDALMSAAAEWAALRSARPEGAGSAEMRAVQASIRTLADWHIPHSPAALGGTAEGDLLLAALANLEQAGARHARRPLRDWLGSLEPGGDRIHAAGFGAATPAQRRTLERLGARSIEPDPAHTPVTVATADDDDHELELIAAWCRAHLEIDNGRRLLVVDAKLRQRRPHYERLLSQTLTPGEWLATGAREAPRAFAIEGGRPLDEFPVIHHAQLTLRLLTGRLRLGEVAHWLRLPFLDREDVLAGAAVESFLRDARRIEYSGDELVATLARGPAPCVALADRMRAALAALAGERRSPAEWAPRLLAALQQLGWYGSRALRSDEQQTVARWHALLDEYAALGAWLPRSDAALAATLLGEMAAERRFDPQSVAAPITLTESHDDPLIRYDGIWVAGLDAAQWPAPPRPDVFIPLRLQTQAGVPWASAALQARAARRALECFRACTPELVCSWARLDGDAQRSPSPLLTHLPERRDSVPATPVSALAAALAVPHLEAFDDAAGVRVNTALPVRGGVRALELQGECGFRAYGELRLNAPRLEQPAPGLDARERGMLLHKALELTWEKLDRNHFSLAATDASLWRQMVEAPVQAAITHVFRGYVPRELAPSVERERARLEKLIVKLLEVEKTRTPFEVEALEAQRSLSIAGGEFTVRIDRIDRIEGGGFAILDYKSGRARAPRWNDVRLRDPQLLAYLLAERGRDVQALANVFLSQGEARFMGRAARKHLLPGVEGLNPAKIPGEEIALRWNSELDHWLAQLQALGARFIAGDAPVEPGSDVCRNCHLTVLCRRVELAAPEPEPAEDTDE